VFNWMRFELLGERSCTPWANFFTPDDPLASFPLPVISRKSAIHWFADCQLLGLGLERASSISEFADSQPLVLASSMSRAAELNSRELVLEIEPSQAACR
jgi:hypothetical protein